MPKIQQSQICGAMPICGAMHFKNKFCGPARDPPCIIHAVAVAAIAIVDAVPVAIMRRLFMAAIESEVCGCAPRRACQGFVESSFDDSATKRNPSPTYRAPFG